MRHGPTLTLALLLLAACGSGDGNEAANGASANEAAANGAGAEPGGTGNAAGAAGNGVAAAPGTAPAAAGRGVRMQPGQWEITAQLLAMNIPGMRPEAAEKARRDGPRTTRNCLTPEQAARSGPEMVTGSLPPGCDRSGLTVSGGRVRGTVTCTRPEGTMRATIDGTFAATSFEVDQTVEMRPSNGPAGNTRIRASGRRIGECPPRAAGTAPRPPR
jgi:hypothetical protein